MDAPRPSTSRSVRSLDPHPSGFAESNRSRKDGFVVEPGDGRVVDAWLTGCGEQSAPARDDVLASVVASSRIDVPSNRDPTRDEIHVTGSLVAPWYINARRRPGPRLCEPRTSIRSNSRGTRPQARYVGMGRSPTSETSELAETRKEDIGCRR